MTGVRECSQQRGNLKDNRYIFFFGGSALWCQDSRVIFIFELI
ncbi:conserved hypothetical protein [Photorhabdus asymbiotica]|uniref:Uncharacterized protein n=1 Tax=Photorhabdus asymbiotica subsp. asymbiotica (strain ATCC 43949 / 3105-77) TaxID=553480 RepID=C7BSR5_PHOAA|nr:hypothetical protein [Photorhabdus asymbiotica]CAQ83759.1 conserved hypothetical protein [Photorhabdus asymbiotica]